MPGGDETGPMGMGPMTGGGRGFCVVPMEDWRGPYGGRGFGRGRCRGLRQGRRQLTAQKEIVMLTEEKYFLETRIKELKEQAKNPIEK